ncbi:MAG: RagB/SusD family nutrient uptake outer membrane protein, partial [Bacteroidales bacterium]|nr:RagB/SusD family nutrient uptake outer membrane protein [Bacteroidales bacterium]
MKKILYFLMALVLLVPTSCSDFLERSSLVDLDDNTYWNSEGNVRLFV